MFKTLINLFAKKDNAELRNAIAKGAFLVDVRSAAEFSAGSVSGAVNIPLNSIQEQLRKFKGKDNIVVFCRSGSRSSQAQSILLHNGFKGVINGVTWQNVNSIVHNINSKK